MASEDDPFIALERAGEFSSAWGARLTNVGRQGHINVESGHGQWPEGARLLEALLAESAEDGHGLRPTG